MKEKTRMMQGQIVINIVAIALFVLLLNLSILVYPQDGMQTRNTMLNFRWIGFSSYAIIDDNPSFTSPIRIEKNQPIELSPGTYYWCVPFLKGCLQKTSFEVESEVSVTGKKITEGGGNAAYQINNTGNIATKIETINLLGRLITGLFILEPRGSKIVEINETAKIIATQR
jgi:hypothetical protein